MIVYESGGAPNVRGAEVEVAGRRIAARAIASGGEIGPPAFRFDPVERCFVARRPSGVVTSGPHDPLEWSAALAKAPSGPVLVEGGAGAAEEVRGSFRAAAEGARMGGRGAYLLDAPLAALPVPLRPLGLGALGTPSPSPWVLLCAWSPDPEAFEERLSSIAAAAALRIPAGVLWPVFPGWTDASRAEREWLRPAVAAGAKFAVPLAPASGVEARRAAVDARQLFDPSGAETFFDTMFHAPWESDLPEALQAARRAVLDAGLSAYPPRPAAEGQPPANTRAAARLEELAAEAGDEHRAARLLAAARWVDACGRDLGAIRREGNLVRAFPLGTELASDLERAVREAEEEVG